MVKSNSNRFELVDSDERLNELCQALCSEKLLALDTEFVRTNTFYGQLGLIQLYADQTCYLIDPIKVNAWDPFCEIFCEPKRLVILHSASEDLNLLSTSLNITPSCLFDSQIAGAFLGLGFSLSYQAIVQLILGQYVEKDVTRSNWLARPLSKRQLRYAADDVYYLPALEENLRKQLILENKVDWFEDECLALLETSRGFEDPSNWESSYSQISGSWKLATENLECLQQLCYWRETQARQRNKPKSWIAKDSDLLTMSTIIGDSNHISIKTLMEETKIDKRFLDRDGEEIIERLSNSRYQLKPIEKGVLNYPLSSASRKILKQCQERVSEVAAKLSIVPELLARKRLLQKLVKDYEYSGTLIWPKEFSGWRKEVLNDSFTQIFSS
tara:strand:- start:3559 stop:4713 length:1155 start_codon:yes stop_codon:yes gene_type:complete